MKYYEYDPVTFLFKGVTVFPDSLPEGLDPPANATTVEAPLFESGSYQKFVPEAGGVAEHWIQTPDLRGQLSYQGSTIKVIDYIGDVEDGWSIDKTTEILALENWDSFKKDRTQKVANLKVEINGMIFDADEVSQERMARAIIAAEFMSQPVPLWKLANNTEVNDLPVAILKQALAAAMQAMAAIWTPQQV